MTTGSTPTPDAPHLAPAAAGREGARAAWQQPAGAPPPTPVDAAPPVAPPPVAAPAVAPPAPAPIADVPRPWLLHVVGAALGTIALIVLFSVTGTAEMAPGHALVYAQPTAGVYYSPACAVGKGATQLTTIADAKVAGYRADATCWSDGGFLGSGGSRWMDVLRSVGLYPEKRSRWRADGSWRW